MAKKTKKSITAVKKVKKKVTKTPYKLTDETCVRNGRTLHRIELTKDCKWGEKGDKGGWIEKKSNLQGNAWVSFEAMVYGNAKVYGNAWVGGNAMVYDNAEVRGNAMVYGNVWVGGNAKVFDNAKVYGNAKVYDNAEVRGNAKVWGSAKVGGMKTLTADKVLKFLMNLQERGADLKTIKVNYREDYNSDVVSCGLIEEDLYDEQTNSVLTSICIVTKK